MQTITQFSKNIHKITIYMGYGAAGKELRQRVNEALKATGIPAREFLLQALHLDRRKSR